MPYQPSRGGGGIVVILVLMLIAAIFLFIFMGDKLTITQKWHEKVFSIFDVKNKVSITTTKDTKTLIIPPSENEWCKLQTMNVGDTQEDPIWDKIIGWDSEESCCVREVYGYNCALNREVSVQYCYTSHIGGKIKWSMVDGYYGDVDIYKNYIDQQDKVYITNKPCNNSIYPEELRGT